MIEKKAYVLGLMSGSSLDGLDIAYCHFSGLTQWKFICGKTYNFPADLLENLRGLRLSSIESYLKIEHEFSIFCSESIASFIESFGANPDYIGSHGHTVFHNPDVGYSTQIGSGATISAKTKLPCVSDFRQGDVALHGQGAPLASLIDQQLFGDFDVLLNLGGIANLTFNGLTPVSFDVVPCNQVLNHFSDLLGHSFDDRGEIARQGKVIPSLLEAWESLPYFAKAAPKSMANEWVQDTFIPIGLKSPNSIEDKLASSIELISDKIVGAIKSDYARQGRLLITGGGAYNDYLIEKIETQLVDIEVVIPEPEIVDFKEGILMAYLAYLRMNNQNNIFGSATGADRNNRGGAIYHV